MRTLFFSSVAHELRTPLNSIIPMCKQLKKYVIGNKGPLLLEIIHNSSIHLGNVIEDFLDVTRIENKKFETNIAAMNIRKEVE